jgi:hypothetical protein
MASEKLHVLDKIPSGVMAQTVEAKGRGLSAAALIKQNEPPFSEIKELRESPT